MRTTQQMCITLPNEMAAQTKERVSSGEYASECEVIREGYALAAREQAAEKWLREQVVPAYEALKADLKCGISSMQLRKEIAEKNRKISQ